MLRYCKPIGVFMSLIGSRIGKSVGAFGFDRIQDFLILVMRLGWRRYGFILLSKVADARLRRILAVLTAVAVALVGNSIFMIGSLAAIRKGQFDAGASHGASEVVALESKNQSVTGMSHLDRPIGNFQNEVERKQTSRAASKQLINSRARPPAAIAAEDVATKSRSVLAGRESVRAKPTSGSSMSRQLDQQPEVEQVGTMMMPTLPLAKQRVKRVAFAEPNAQQDVEEENTADSAPPEPATEKSTNQVKRRTSESREANSEVAEPTGSSNEADGPKEVETIGVPPPQEQPQFLRNDSVLMTPGDYQWEIGISYARNLNQSPVGQFIEDSAIVGNLRRVNRVLQMPLELRVGLTKDFQGSVSLPIGWANQEVSVSGADLTDGTFGIGDLTLGLTRLIRQGDLTEPNVLGFFSLSIPTGQAALATSLEDPAVALGRGIYSMTVGMTVTKTIDPLVFFYGGGYQHNFEARFAEFGRLNPGNGAFYRLGVGYAVNSSVSLSTAFTGAFLENSELDDRRLGGTSREPLSLRIAATVVTKKKSARKARTVEPFVNLGLNDDATDTILGVTWTY